MYTLGEVKTLLSEKKQLLCSKYPIRSLAIFGSFARNEQNENSDLDLIVELDGRIGSKFIDLAEEIENFIGFKVDLVSKNGIKDKYLRSIQRDLIYV